MRNSGQTGVSEAIAGGKFKYFLIESK
jgi:hypothetical protein